MIRSTPEFGKLADALAQQAPSEFVFKRAQIGDLPLYNQDDDAGGVRRLGVTMISGQATDGLAPDQVLILKGPWSWTHNLFMETK